MIKFLAAALAATALATPGFAAPQSSLAQKTVEKGLLPVQVDRTAGRILLTLPPPGADGVSGRFLYAVALRTGLGAAPTMLDRGRIGDTQILAFRRIGNRIAAEFENPRFRAEQAAARHDFATSIVWMGKIESVQPDGSLTVDIAPFLASDTLGVAASLDQATDTLGVGGGPQGAGKGFKLDEKLSGAEPASVKVFPDNIEMDAVQTYTSDTPGAEVSNIAPDPHKVTLTLHTSLVRLPGPGFVPRAFDPRIGGFATQVVDFSAPLGADVVRDLANRYRLEKVDPAAPRSRVKKPIIFYVDPTAPEPIRSALVEGISWWSKAFDDAGLIDAFQVKLLPPGADPMDVRYNIVHYVDRATRGWSYGQQIVDPRTGEIVKGMVVIGSLRVRQDLQIFQGLVGADKVGSGGPEDPVRAALARIRQLGAHEVGHSLGFAHNFAASTQDRASVMDYPAPRILLKDGKPDLSDAYGVGVGAWDEATADWLYGEPDDRAAQAKAAAVVASGLRYVEDSNARAEDTAQPWASLWDDGADPTAELDRMMKVRTAALANFGLNALTPGEPMADLRRRFVPIWLLHRYQLVAAAKAIGGVDFAYSVAGGPREASPPVPPSAQRAALDAVLTTLSPAALTVPPRLLPLLSSARNGTDNRQYDIEIFQTAGGPVFDPLVAADVAAQMSLDALLAPKRLARVSLQHAADAKALGVDELVDKLIAATIDTREGALGRRIAYRTVATLARTARAKATPPDVAAQIDERLHQLGTRLAAVSGTGEDAAWAHSLARLLATEEGIDRLLKDQPPAPTIPPGMPIGSGEPEWMDLG